MKFILKLKHAVQGGAKIPSFCNTSAGVKLLAIFQYPFEDQQFADENLSSRSVR